MSGTLTVTEVVRHFAEYLNRVAYRRESFVLVRGKKPIAELRPLPIGRRLAEPAATAAEPPNVLPRDLERTLGREDRDQGSADGS